MEFLKCRDVRKGPEKRKKLTRRSSQLRQNIPTHVARYGWMQPRYMRNVSFWGKFTSGGRISRTDLHKLPNGAKAGTFSRPPHKNSVRKPARC